MQKLMAMLGLPPDASEDAACAALKKIQDDAAAANKSAADAQAQFTKQRREAFIAKHGITGDTAVAAFTKAHEANPEAAESAYTLAKGEPSKTRIDARSAQTPGAHSDTDAKSKTAAQNAAVSAYRAGNPGASYGAAWVACRAADPALFTDEATGN